MPYPGYSVSVNWLGTIAGTDEVWSTGLTFAQPVVTQAAAEATRTNIVAVGQGVTDAFLILMKTAAFGWADYSVLQGAKIAVLDPAGHYVDDPSVITTTDSSPHGSLAGVPAQDTVCLSLRSGSSFGKGNYGRMYLPHTLPNISSGGPFISTGGQSSMLAAAATFLNSAQAWAAPAVPVIASQAGAGSFKPVTQVGMGRVLDTQRRRRNRLEEAYAFTAV